MKQIISIMSDREGFFRGMVRGAMTSTGFLTLLILFTACGN